MQKVSCQCLIRIPTIFILGTDITVTTVTIWYKNNKFRIVSAKDLIIFYNGKILAIFENFTIIMKNFLIFFAGLLCGIILLVLGVAIFSSSESNVEGLTILDKPGKTMDVQTYKVFQVIEGGHALATSAISETANWFIGPTVLIYGNEKTNYYDDLILKAGKNQEYRQVGIYQYITKDGDSKTVPVIAIFSKK